MVQVMPQKTKETIKYGEEGMLCIAGKHLYKEYYQEPEKTKETKFMYKKNEYYKTGNIGVLDKEGYFTLTGRSSRYYIRSDLNKVYLEHIQSVISLIDVVEAACVVPKPDKDILFTNKAYVVLKDGILPTKEVSDHIINMCYKPLTNPMTGETIQLKPYEIPESITFLETLPRTVADKVDYKLLEELGNLDYLPRIKTMQENWIGKSTGAEVDFKIDGTDDKLTVFTTRPDTLYGVTFMVMSPEHKYLEKYESKISNIDEVHKYQEYAKSKTDIERTDLTKEKTGVKLEGLEAINPVNDKKIEIWISDYVLSSYGTGAIMAVPAHDERDYEFATKFNIPIIEVIKGGDISKEAYTGDGEMVNSGVLNGMTNKKDSIKKMIEFLEDKKIGKKKINYRLQDWIFSRQRFWGEPIPMIYCEKCGWQPMDEKDLPLLLPDIAEYEPTEDGQSPLAKIEDWVKCKCPKCGGDAKRETDTMPNWAGSSWYFLRFMDPHNDKEFASMDAMKYWQRVDWYNGGMEHTARHLLYARFWVQFLYNIGLVPNKEMIWTRISHGMILGDNNEKMSKSRGNVVNPDDMVKAYGADALRVYEMFIGDYEKDAAWSENGLKGCKRFIDKIYRLKDKVNDSDLYTESLEILINKTIKKVTEDIDTMNYNTAVSALMILANAYDKLDTISRKDYRTLLVLLNPIAPHITEELNEILKLGKPICESEWLTYDENKINDETVNIAVSVNGKLRATFSVSKDIDKDELLNIAKSQENVI